MSQRYLERLPAEIESEHDIKPRAPGLCDVLYHYPIQQQLLSHLEINELSSLTRTCKQFTGLYQHLLKTRWDINRRLKHFVKNPPALRSHMATCDALISGSFALQFFEGVFWEESDLDIFVGKTEALDKFKEHLVEIECYKHVLSVDPIDGGYGDELHLFFEVDTYTRKGEHNKETKIQIITYGSPPLRHILSGFYTTAILNVISWNRAYALFPNSTFIFRETYRSNYHSIELREERAKLTNELLKKYENRGWTFREIRPVHRVVKAHNQKHSRQQHASWERRIGDPGTWKIELDTTNVQPSKTPDSVYEFSSFSINLRLAPFGISYYDIGIEAFRNHVLQYAYTFDGNFHPIKNSSFWFHVAGPKLDVLFQQERDKIPVKNRPEWLTYGSYSCCNRNNKYPESWTYYDHLIPKWYENWNEKGRETTGC